MSDIGKLHHQSYDDDNGDLDRLYGTSGSGSASRTRGDASSSRVRPYPQPNGRSSRARNSSRAVLDDENDPGIRVQGDAMDVDVDAPRAPRQDHGMSTRTRGENDDVRQLLRAWQNERHAPDILPACDELLGRILDSIRRQVDITNTLRSADMELSEEDHYRTTLVQTEVERVKFVVRSYVRTRLSKIEQYAAYITMNSSIHTRLTRGELRHAQRYGELVVSQFSTTVLGHLPEPQRALDDVETPAVPKMITEPDKSVPVFFHAFDTIEGLQLDDGTTLVVPKDSIMLIPYRVIEQHVLRGEVELV